MPLRAGLTAASLAVLIAGPGAGAAVRPRILVPAYFDPPSRTWTTALSAPAQTILIANPDNGPGASAQPAYGQLISRARTGGRDLIGYVYTSSGSRPISSVERDIDRWATFYGIHGIFFDEVSQSPAQLWYYRKITAYAHAHDATVVVLNPGTVPARGYFGLDAIVVTFEDTYAAFRHTSFPHWLRREPAVLEANIVYAVPDAADARSTLAAMRAHGVGVGYVTGAGTDGSNPYAGLPPYYGSETGWLSR